jgi:hypothetical protein
MEGGDMIAFFRMGTPLPGKRRAAGEYAKSIAEYITSTHGVECGAAIKIGGPSGRVGIRATFDDLAALDAWIEKARSDETYMKLTESAAGVMGPDSEDAVWKTI